MTRVDFHTGVADPLGHTCRLVRKAWRSGHRVVVTGSPELLARLDLALWTFDPGDFIPHARLRAGQAAASLLERTPVWLADRPGDAPAAEGVGEVLVNLGPETPAGFERYPRVIEIVAQPDDAVASGRQRWRRYQSLGLAPTNHPQPAP
ncbi:MAG: DNA polymerase III subunit chi [Burkholderiaceae bacterium]|nr:DNA polymerase III subunit chi [Burkholderiaceae bacterium]